MSRKPLYNVSKRRKRDRLQDLAPLINAVDDDNVPEHQAMSSASSDSDDGRNGNHERVLRENPADGRQNVVLDNMSDRESECGDEFFYECREEEAEVGYPGEDEQSDEVDEEEEEPLDRESDREESNDDEYDAGEVQEDEDPPRMPRMPRMNDLHAEQPLYRGAPLSVDQSMLLLLTILIHHNVTYLCLADIITVINFHCITQNLKKNSLFKFQKYFGLEITQVKKHYYCKFCLRSLPSVREVCPSCPQKKNSYFVELPFINQLREMYRRKNFYNDLQSRFTRPEPLAGGWRDIYDGDLYKEWVNNQFLSNPNNISLSWYTDGFPVYKSSQISAWPVYLTINELPFAMRKKKDNTILAGLWYGDQKPQANMFMEVFRSTFESLWEGVDVTISNDDRIITVRAVLLTGTCDLQAKSQFLNFTQYNGAHGCTFCYCKGESYGIAPGSSVHVYPYEENPRIRTSGECVEYARNATPQNRIMGIKGPTVLSKIMPDFIKGMAIDKMHGVDGGIVKKILELLFNVEYRQLPFSLYGFTDVINSRLTSIKPPKFVHRMPRSVDDLCHWKASELKLWFLYYSVPILEGILREDYFQHYLLLVLAISILNSDEITPLLRETARDLLHKFVREFQTLYGLRHCIINLHQLLHLPDVVKNLGPLWTMSCFEYENLNGRFLKLVHGTWHIDTQIVKSHNQFIEMIRSVEKLPEGPMREFCLSRKRQVKLNELISPSCYSVGCYKRLDTLSEEMQTAMQNAGLGEHEVVSQYYRLLKDGKLYVSTSYQRSLQTESYIVHYTENGESKLGSINCFAKLVLQCDCQLPHCECPRRHVAIIYRIIADDCYSVRGDRYRYDSHKLLLKCHVTNYITAIEVDHLQAVCVRMMIDDQLYVGLPVNTAELE